MAVAQASALQDALKTKMDELEAGLQGISDADAARKPAADEWSVKELLSHLSGENDDFLRWVRQIAETDTPELDLVPGQTHFSAQRASQPVAQLLAGDVPAGVGVFHVAVDPGYGVLQAVLNELVSLDRVRAVLDDLVDGSLTDTNNPLRAVVESYNVLPPPE